MKIDAIVEGDFLHLKCSECGEHTTNRLSHHGIVPTITSECSQHGDRGYRKLIAPYWPNFPGQLGEQ